MENLGRCVGKRRRCRDECPQWNARRCGFHFDPKGETIERAPLMHIRQSGRGRLQECLRRASIFRILKHARARFARRRGYSENKCVVGSENFPERNSDYLSRGSALLQERGVKLLGLDVPSVDSTDSKDLHNHHALAEARIAIVESLDLSKVEGGIYNFAALPLKILGGDAGPVRAILWRE